MKLPSTPPDLSTLSRDYVSNIAQAVVDPLYQTYVQNAQNKYEHWEKTKHRAKGQSLNPHVAWFMIQIQRQINRKPLPLLTDKKNHPMTFWLTDESQRQLMLIDQELSGRLASLSSTRFSTEQKDSFIINSLMEEAIASSLLEGAMTTRKEAKQMLRSNSRPRSEGEQMIVNNYHAMLFIKDHLQDKLTVDFVHELHRIISDKTMPEDQIARWRQPKDRIEVVDSRDDEIMHVPPEASELNQRMKSLFKFANQDWQQSKTFVHPIIRAIAIHFQFAYEHPYCDGNGRVARALFYWSALRSGYWLFEFLPLSTKITKSAIRYGKAFIYTETDGFDLGYFLAYHLRVIKLAQANLQVYLEKQIAKRTEASKLQQQDGRLNARQTLMMHKFRQSNLTSMTITQHQIEQNIAYPTARLDLRELVHWGYLVVNKQGKKQVFKLAEK